QGRPMFAAARKGRDLRGAAFSVDAQRLAVLDQLLGTLSVRGATAAGETIALKQQMNNLTSVAFSPDGRKVAAGTLIIKVWDTASGAELQTLKGHRGTVLCLAFSPDGERIISGSSDHTARVWNAATGDEILTLEG